jgi:hypothetical protein
MYITRRALRADSNDKHIADYAIAAQWAPWTMTAGDAYCEAAMGHESLTWVFVDLELALTFIIVFAFAIGDTTEVHHAATWWHSTGCHHLCGCGDLRRGYGESHCT